MYCTMRLHSCFEFTMWAQCEGERVMKRQTDRQKETEREKDEKRKTKIGREIEMVST